MHLIYSHPKDVFKSTLGFGKREILAWSGIITLIGFAVYDAFKDVTRIAAGIKGSVPPSPTDFLFVAAIFAALYVVGRSILQIVARRVNARMNDQIDSARSAVEIETGIELDHLDMSHLMQNAVLVGSETHVEKLDGTEYTLLFNTAGDNLTIHYSAVIQHKYSPIKPVLGGLS